MGTKNVKTQRTWQWKVLEYADWGNTTDYKTIGREMAQVFTPQALEYTEKFYQEKLEQLNVVLGDHAEQKTGDRHGYYGLGDDGFWDLRAHIIGLGEKFYSSVINDPEKAKVIADDGSYVENFGYIFHYTNHRTT